eukprot:CAMPEP_0197514088 /NCGR_PEP_ID=MMETSP1312-20131121/81076_1 /TAXON_ID=464262 /ORGANISM="Genus nov. species nov., Strain RCC2335" /LENGTH=252 /DNA_ID=CAMNT_0043062227 /DNA_START=214 /DNA_END=973 /DNA_ORIENTATION=-
MFRASSRAPTGAGASSVTRVAAIAGNRSSVGRLRLNRPARATETGAEKGSPLKVPVTMDQQLEAQLERLRIAEKENAELKRMIDELEDELDIDFEMLESAAHDAMAGAGPGEEDDDELEDELDIDFEMLESAAHDAMAGAGPTLPQLDESSSAAEEEVAEAIEEQEPEPELAEPSAASFEGAEAVEQEEVVAAMEEAAVAPVVDEPAASCTYTEDEILGWKVKELKAALKGAGLPVSGLKKVLQQRALENLL